MRTKAMKSFLMLAILFISSTFHTAYSQNNQPITDAQKAVDIYLKGMRIFELAEGEQMVTANSWPQWGNIPVLLEYETIFEGIFNTDIPAVKGYKRLLDAKVKSEAGTPLQKRILLIAYPDATDKKWRVLVFTTGTDVGYEVAAAEKRLGDTRFVKDQFNYRVLAYWYAAAGRLNDSYRKYQQAALLNSKNPDWIPQSDFDTAVETLRRIIKADSLRQIRRRTTNGSSGR